MQAITALLTHKKQSFAWTILLTGVATTRTRLRSVVRVDRCCDRARERCFVADQRVQLGKGPLGVDPVGLALLGRDRFKASPVLLTSAFSAPGALIRLLHNSVYQSQKYEEVGNVSDLYGRPAQPFPLFLHYNCTIVHPELFDLVPGN